MSLNPNHCLHTEPSATALVANPWTQHWPSFQSLQSTPGHLRRRWMIRVFRMCLPGALGSVGMVVFHFNCQNMCFLKIYMCESKSNGIFWVRIPWSKLFADVCWPDSEWFPSQYCLFGCTHREICVLSPNRFSWLLFPPPHWLLWLQAFPPVSVDSLLGFSVSFNCIKCSPEFRDKVRKSFWNWNN